MFRWYPLLAKKGEILVVMFGEAVKTNCPFDNCNRSGDTI